MGILGLVTGSITGTVSSVYGFASNRFGVAFSKFTSLFSSKFDDQTTPAILAVKQKALFALNLLTYWSDMDMTPAPGYGTRVSGLVLPSLLLYPSSVLIIRTRCQGW